MIDEITEFLKALIQPKPPWAERVKPMIAAHHDKYFEKPRACQVSKRWWICRNAGAHGCGYTLEEAYWNWKYQRDMYEGHARALWPFQEWYQ